MDVLVQLDQQITENQHFHHKTDLIPINFKENLGDKAKVITPNPQESISVIDNPPNPNPISLQNQEIPSLEPINNPETILQSQDSVDEQQGVMVMRKCYSRDEIESISSLNIEQEKILWDEIYCKMGASVVKEYEEIIGSTSKPRKQGGSKGKKLDHSMNKEENGSSRRSLKKKVNGSLHGEVSDMHMEHNLKENVLCEDFGGSAYDAIMDSDIVENECNEGIESDSEDEFDNIQRPAFMVEGDPDFDSGPPQDGLEFLRRVRWEAARIPKVKVAKIDKSTLTTTEQTVYMPIIHDIAKCPEHLLPSKDWEEAFLEDFSELRQSLTRVDTLSENSSYPQKHININNEDLGTCSTDEPKLSTIVGMDVVSRASLLRNRIKSFENKEALSRDECLWLYALSAAIDTPFDADMGASLRCLLRKCAKLRSQKTEFDDEVVMLNILVTVSGKYFGQSES